MFFIMSIFTLVQLLGMALNVLAYPNDLGCSRSLAVGSSIMGNTAQSDSSRSIVVTLNGVALQSGSTYVAGETLVVSLSNVAGVQYIFQTQNGQFTTNPRCSSNVRTLSNNANLQMPKSGTVTIWAGWAAGYSTVSVSSTFSLSPPISPMISPTAAPSAAVMSPTPIPTASPTALRWSAPSFAPSYLPGNPTLIPTFRPSTCPSTSPSLSPIFVADSPMPLVASEPLLKPTPHPVTSIQLMSSSTNSRLKVLLGFTLGGGATICIVLFFAKKLADIRIVSSLLFAIASLALVLAWATRNSMGSSSTSFNGFLGIPSWSRNLLPVHPLLMTAGFFVAQIFAIGSWSVLTERKYAKCAHVLFQCIAVSMMIAGLCAIVSYKKAAQLPSLTTIQSWSGVACVLETVIQYAIKPNIELYHG